MTKNILIAKGGRDGWHLSTGTGTVFEVTYYLHTVDLLTQFFDDPTECHFLFGR